MQEVRRRMFPDLPTLGDETQYFIQSIRAEILEYEVIEAFVNEIEIERSRHDGKVPVTLREDKQGIATILTEVDNKGTVILQRKALTVEGVSERKSAIDVILNLLETEGKSLVQGLNLDANSVVEGELLILDDLHHARELNGLLTFLQNTIATPTILNWKIHDVTDPEYRLSGLMGHDLVNHLFGNFAQSLNFLPFAEGTFRYIEIPSQEYDKIRSERAQIGELDGILFKDKEGKTY